MIRGRERLRGALAVAAWAGAAFAWAAPARGQALADYDYENLSFRGIAVEVGRIFPTRVEPTSTIGVRMDLGYLGPGLRIVPAVTYWSSTLKRERVRELEERIEELVEREAGPGFPPINLGTIDWADLVLSLDGHVVWRAPTGLLAFAGMGASAHILNGGGEAIAGTFVEDLLDQIKAGANLHAGVEYPLGRRFRAYGVSRYEVLRDFQYFELRLGGQVMVGGAAPGEQRRLAGTR